MIRQALTTPGRYYIMIIQRIIKKCKNYFRSGRKNYDNDHRDRNDEAALILSARENEKGGMV